MYLLVHVIPCLCRVVVPLSLFSAVSAIVYCLTALCCVFCSCRFVAFSNCILLARVTFSHALQPVVTFTCHCELYVDRFYYAESDKWHNSTNPGMSINQPLYDGCGHASPCKVSVNCQLAFRRQGSDAYIIWRIMMTSAMMRTNGSLESTNRCSQSQAPATLVFSILTDCPLSLLKCLCKQALTSPCCSDAPAVRHHHGSPARCTPASG